MDGDMRWRRGDLERILGGILGDVMDYTCQQNTSAAKRAHFGNTYHLPHVNTRYKRKDKKVLPANVPLPADLNIRPTPGARLEESQNRNSLWIPEVHGGKTVPRGSRLTPERLSQMKIGGSFLSPQEKQLFVDILFEFEGAVAFDETEMGMLHESIEPPIEIHTIPHTPWQQQNLRLPQAMRDEATKHVKKMLELGIFEFCQGPYRNRYFLVAKKKPGEWRFIHDVQALNKVTIRESGMPPNVDEFSEEFAGCPITSSIDYFSGYTQIPLATKSRDMTGILTELGLVRATRMMQGWVSGVSTFMGVICKVHYRQIPQYVRPFVDDVGIRGPSERYGDREVSPGVRQFVYEHAQIFREFMRDVWVSGLTIAGNKCALGMTGIVVVGMVCDSQGRRPEWGKVQRIVDWPIPRTTKEARAFIGVAVYYRIFISSFSIIAAPIFALFRKGARFAWNPDCQQAMDRLKHLLSTAPILIKLDYSPSALPIILNVDASTQVGWGAVLSQMQEDGKPRPARYESGVWNDAEKKYDAVKLECRGLMNALKKLRFWLYGRHFLLETDAQTLVWLVNQPPNDLPNAMLTRWLTYIRLFDFDVKHIPGSKNGAADALSRRGKSSDDNDESDAEDYFESRLNLVSVSDAHPTARVWLIDGEYSGDDLLIAQYLETLQRPDGISNPEFLRFKKKSQQFLVRDGYLFKKSKRGTPPRRVIGREELKEMVIKELHDEMGHRGVKATYEQAARRYQWKGMYVDVEKWVKSCDECQRRSKLVVEEGLVPTWSITVWGKVHLDVVYLPWALGGYKYAVFARDDLSGWIEGKALRDNDSKEVAKFVFEDIVCRHGCPFMVVVDGGSENKGELEELLRVYGVKRVETSAYHPQSNGLVERGHEPIVNCLAKYCHEDPMSWPTMLPLALWADRISVRRSHGYTPFELVYGRDAILPIDLQLESWSIVDWEFDVKDSESLLLARMKQLDERNLKVSQATWNLENSRKANKAWFDTHRRLRHTPLKVGDLVLLYNTVTAKSRSVKHKLEDKWRGPYRIREIPQNSTHYYLEELDGVPLAKSFAGNRLKKYFSRFELERMRVAGETRNDENGDGDAEVGKDDGVDKNGPGEDEDLYGT